MRGSQQGRARASSYSQLLAVSACLVAACALSACDSRSGQPGGAAQAAKPVNFNSTDITGVEHPRSLDLPDADGRPRSLAEFKGKVVVVFFGYTHCPDFCPTTLAQLAQVKHALGPDGDKLVGIFVTVDPQRDDPKLLKAYVQGFDPGFVALRGTPEQVAAAAKEFNVFYEKVPGRNGADYTVDHTAASFVFDPQGRPRLFVHSGEDNKSLTADVKALLNGA